MPVQRRSRWASAFEGLSNFIGDQAQLLPKLAMYGATQKFELQKQHDAQLQAAIQQLSNHPEQFDQLARGMQAHGIDLTSFAPTAEERLGPLTKQIQGAKSSLDLPTDVGAMMKTAGLSTAPGFGALPAPPAPVGPPDPQAAQEPPTLPSRPMGPVENPMLASLQKQVSGREAAITAEDASKVEQAGLMAQSTAHGTGTGAAQATHETFPTWLADKKSELEQQGAIDLTNQKRLNPVLAQRAGMERGAALSAEFTDPKIVAAKLNFIKQEGVAKALAAGAMEQATMINDAVNVISSIQPDWELMKTLSTRVNGQFSKGPDGKVTNTNPTANPGTYYITSPLQMNPDATQLDSISQNMSKRLANDKMFGGNRGAQSEKDSQAIAARLPNSYDSAESAARKIESFNKNMFQGLDALSHLDPSAPADVRVNAMRKSLGLDPVDFKTGMPQGSAPGTSPLLDSILSHGPTRP